MKTWRYLSSLGVFAFLALQQARGCGLSLELPKLHFDGVEENGYVCYFEKLADVALDDKNVLSMTLNFNSHRQASSPYVGKGWSIPFLDSHVEPVDENGFKIFMPNGLIYDFGRIAGEENMFSGNFGWKAAIEGDTLTAWASCGWKLVFQKGRIWEITTPQNRILSYRYNAGVATEIDARDGASNRTLVQAETDAATGTVTDLIIGSQRINISQAQRPRIMTKFNQNLVIGFDQSLSQLQWPDGKKESFIFGTDKLLNPTLTIAHSNQVDRDFTWDPSSGVIIQDGAWKYDVSISQGVGDISRSDDQKHYEALDVGPGKVVEIGSDGQADRDLLVH
jgi:hypothetical protein